MRKKRTLGTMVTTGFMATAIAMTAFMAGCSAQAAGDTEEQEHAEETDSSGTCLLYTSPLRSITHSEKRISVLIFILRSILF